MKQLLFLLIALLLPSTLMAQGVGGEIRRPTTVSKPQPQRNNTNRAKKEIDRNLYSEELEQLANRGDVDAQFDLAFCYINGTGVSQDYMIAAKWLEKAADQGLADAQYVLGLFYQNSYGVNQDNKKAFQLMKKAAEQGELNAMTNLGVCYYGGVGVEKNSPQAAIWLIRASDKGDYEAMTILGEMYLIGDGVVQNYPKAVEYFTKATNQDIPRAQFNLGYCYENGLGVDTDLDKAVELYTKAAKQEYEDAKQRLQAIEKYTNIIFPVIQNLIANMVYVEGGTFTMGDKDNKPKHKVTISSFAIGKYEVTQKEWETVMGYNPSYFKGDNKPVEGVSWEDCQTFINELNNITGAKFRLPTEAEWEFSARGGNHSKGYKFSGSDDLNKVAWNVRNSSNTTHDIGTKSSNELGLYDMSGNVTEWCHDWYDGSYYRLSPNSNPQGPSTGTRRVARGGSFSDGLFCDVSNRLLFLQPDSRINGYGFRLALTIE